MNCVLPPGVEAPFDIRNLTLSLSPKPIPALRSLHAFCNYPHFSMVHEEDASRIVLEELAFTGVFDFRCGYGVGLGARIFEHGQKRGTWAYQQMTKER
jgi:hypothetical protein